MVTFYKAKSVHSAAKGVLAALKETRGRSIIIVPDAFTLSLETGALAKLGLEGTFDIEVMSFARLAAVALGKSIEKCLSPAGCVMLMEKVIRKCEPSLLVYGRVAKKPGFASEVYAAITVVRNSGISVERLTAAAEKLDGYVKDKTADIALLYGAYLEELALHHTDSTTRLEALVQEIRAGSVLADANFFVMDHIDFNAKQMEVLGALMEKAQSVSVAVADHGGSENRRVYPTATLLKLRAVAKKAGVSVREITVNDNLSQEKALIADKLFSYAYREGSTENIRLAAAKDREEEVTLIATEITRLVRKEGRRFRDVAIITPSFEDYLPTVERIFSYYDIPFFPDARVPLSECDVFSHILAAADLSVKNFERTAVSKYLSHFLFDASADDKANFDDYVVKYGVDRALFTRPFSLGKDDPLYESAERLRVELLAETAQFAAMPKEASVRSFADVTRAYLTENDFDAKIAAYAEKIYEAGYLKESNVIRQAPRAIVQLIATLEEIRGEEIVTREEFLSALRSGAEQVKIASLPVSLDCVYFAPVEQAMYEPINTMFLLGAEDGLFPLERLKEGVLGEREYTAWQKLDIVVENTGVEELGASRFHALQLLLRPSRLYLSYRSDAAPSSCVKQLADIFALAYEKAGDLLASGYEIDELIPTRKVAENYLVEYSRKEREGLLSDHERSFALAIADILSLDFPLPLYDEMPDAIVSDCFFRKKETSVSEIENYFKCPFLHFVRYGLGAKERDKALSDPRDLGNVVHESVYAFTSDKRNLRLSDEETRVRARKIALEILAAPEYQALAHGEGKHVLERFANAAVDAVFAVKKQIDSSFFIPTYFEEGFGERGKLPALDLGGVKLTGKIDRVDVYDGFVAAIDYKTGSSGASMKEVYYGKKIQLQIYLAVLEKMGYKPAAALYADLGAGGRKESDVFFHGQILKEPHVAIALDRATASERSAYTGLFMKDETELASQRDVTLTEEQMQAMVDYAVEVTRCAVDEISAGYIAPSPLKDSFGAACEYCNAKNICHFANKCPREAAETLHAEDIERVLRTGEEEC